MYMFFLSFLLRSICIWFYRCEYEMYLYVWSGLYVASFLLWVEDTQKGLMTKVINGAAISVSTRNIGNAIESDGQGSQIDIGQFRVTLYKLIWYQVPTILLCSPPFFLPISTPTSYWWINTLSSLGNVVPEAKGSTWEICSDLFVFFITWLATIRTNMIYIMLSSLDGQ